MRDNAQAYLETVLHNYDNKTDSSSTVSFRDPVVCKCAYEILDVQVQTPPEHPDYTLEFNSFDECNPGQPTTCTYFSGYFDIQEPPCVSIINPDCVERWPYLPEQGVSQPLLYLFDCGVPAFSNVSINLTNVWYDPCPFGDYASATVTFRIWCFETCEEYSFSAWVHSNPMTLVWGDPWNPAVTALELGGCGCAPWQFL